MKLDQQYKELTDIKKQIDQILCELSREKIKSLILSYAKNPMLDRLSTKDNQLYMLRIFLYDIWMHEQVKLADQGIAGDIFYGISSLEDVEEKYISIKFGAMRFENHLSKMYCDEIINYYISNQVSGIAIERIIDLETGRQEKNIVEIGEAFIEKGAYIQALILLQEGNEKHPGNVMILRTLAHCWKMGGQWERALHFLQKIKRPNKNDSQEIECLKKVLKDEKV